MPLPKFDYLVPKTLEEACSLLSQYKERAKVIAGGSDLLVRMNQRVASPLYLVDIKHIPNLDYINHNDKEGLRIGALASLHSVESCALIREKFPILAQAASCVASPQIRNVGTIGGNICLDTRCWYYNQSRRWRQSRPACYKTGGERCYVVKGGKRCYSLFSADTVPPLIALGARIRIIGLGSEKVIALEQFYTGAGETVTFLQPDEIVAEVQIPSQPPHSGGIYLKYSLRGALDFAIASVAAVISLSSKNGACTETKIVLGAVSSAPVMALKAAEELQGKEITDDLIEEVAEVATKEASPIVYITTPVDYKRKVLTVLVKRAIRQALGLAKSAAQQ